jgi:PAS domain S-box-containing protein
MQESIPDQDLLTRDKFLNTLAESYVLHETILNSTELSVISAQKDGVINSLNKSAERILGYDADELIGKQLLTIAHHHEELVSRAVELSEELGTKVDPGIDVLVAKVKSQKQTERREWTYARKDGSQLSVSVSITSIWDERGELSGYLAIATDISEQKKADEDLRQSRNHLKVLLESLDDIALEVDEHGTYLSVWTSREDLLFGERKAYVGHTMRELLGDGLGSQFMTAISKVMKTGKPELLEYPSIKPGSDTWYLAKLTQLTKKTVLILVREVTEHKKAELALIDSEQRFRFLAENVPGVIYLCREDEHFSNIFISAKIEQITGYSNNEFLNGTIDIQHLILKDDVVRVDSEFKRALKERVPFSLEYRIHHRNGEVKWLKESGSGISGKDGTRLIEGYISDITERKKSEEALLLSKRNLEVAAKELQQQNKQLNEFAHIISHNLRAPVGNIQALISLLSEDSSVDEYKEVFQNLQKTAVNLRETLNELLDILRVNKEHSMERTVIRFDDVLTKVKQDLMGEILNSNAWIVSDFGACPKIDYYKPYLESIVLNLLSNALKYRHPGREPEIRFETLIVNDKPVLKVHDNGLGIDIKLYGSQIFGLRKVFHENKDARGVGLFLTKSQIEALGGTIKVESVVGVGSTFIVYF